MKRAIKIASICLAAITLSGVLLAAAPASYQAYIAHRCIEAKREFVAVQMCYRDAFCAKNLDFFRTGVAANAELVDVCPREEVERMYGG